MGDMIKVDSAALERFRKVLAEAGEQYKQELKKLENLVNEIVSGTITGDTAEDLRDKYIEKKRVFAALANVIDDAESYAGMQGKRFESTVSDIMSRQK